MFKRLRNNKGELAMVCMLATVCILSGAHYYLTTGKNLFKAKAKTVDTVENPAPAHWEIEE